MYFDVILDSLSTAARKAFAQMDPANYQCRSAFARSHHRKGRKEGLKEGVQSGRAELVICQLETRFGSLSPNVLKRITTAKVAELDAIGVRLLTAETLQAALD